ncbi:MAG: SMC-Scp complex subunit ScpB [Planctomycetes bacterium]|nr:SMC-Scp complex subunit ScpB [Planctomycetota bacterium]
MGDSPEQQPDAPQEQGVTLDGLSAAYAKSLGASANSDAPPVEPEDGSQPADEGGQAGPSLQPALEPPQPEPEASDEQDACPLSPQTILEAMLFVGNHQNEPLAAARAAELMRDVTADEIAPLVARLNQRYAANRCPYRVLSEGAGYRLTLDEPFHSIRNRFYGRVREARLSQAALDVLAIVAYQQPIVADEVNRLRGTPSGHLLSQLVRRQLLRIERPEEKRTPVAYHTTDRFLDLFGLESLEDLPQSEELDQR